MIQELPTLTAVEQRVLGCLVEKDLTTPEYYPLSLNALTNACNQKSNRQPVLALEETDVVRGLDRLRALGLVVQDETGGRVPKYMHTLAGKLRLEPPETAVLAELLLRGPQTPGELRARAERMHPFADLAAVEEVLAELLERESPLVAKLPRQPGRKEHRYAHRLGSQPPATEGFAEARLEAATLAVRAEDDRLQRLEEEVADLRRELAEMREAMAMFRAQFE